MIKNFRMVTGKHETKHRAVLSTGTYATIQAACPQRQPWMEMLYLVLVAVVVTQCYAFVKTHGTKH